ncbi:MAG: hypothetical protein FWB78_12250 [Treponema sp.]|nr:hypothetical protein [Treponema sp.]
MKGATRVYDGGVDAIPTFLVGKWGLTGGTTTQLEINRDGTGSIVGSVWGRELVEWSIHGNRLNVKVERGSGSADYALGDGNELVLSRVRGLLVLVAGVYTPIDTEIRAKDTGGYESFAW